MRINTKKEERLRKIKKERKKEERKEMGGEKELWNKTVSSTDQESLQLEFGSSKDHNNSLSHLALG